jgi:DNA repair protein RecO (recombination protein O)
MPAPQHDLAIILRLTEYSESSQIATVFTATRGLLRLIAKGTRRGTKTRFAAGLDLLERGELGYVPARGDAALGTLTDWRQLESFTGVRRDLLRLYGALYAAELVAQFTEEDDPHPELYDAFVATLSGLAGDAPPAPLITRFQSDLLIAVGYAPELNACVSCRRAIPPSSPVFFSAGAGGLLCRDCEPHYVEKRRAAPAVVGSTPGSGPPAAWFDLLDYHLSHIGGRRSKTAVELAALLHRDTPPRL